MTQNKTRFLETAPNRLSLPSLHSCYVTTTFKMWMGGERSRHHRIANILRVFIFVAVCFLGHSFKPTGIRTAKVSSGALATRATIMEGDSEAFERITLARCATKFFDKKQVPEDILKQVIPSCLRTRQMPFSIRRREDRQRHTPAHAEWRATRRVGLVRSQDVARRRNLTPYNTFSVLNPHTN